MTAELILPLEGLHERLDYIEKYLVDLGRLVGCRYAPFSTGLPAEVAELARLGKTLEAIKLYRKLTDANFEQVRTAVAKASGAGSV